MGTSRYGITDDLLPAKWVAGINDWKGANLGIQDIGWYDGDGGTTSSGNSSLGSVVSRMLSLGYFTFFELFASTKWNRRDKPQGNTNYLSIEDIHNVVHVSILSGTSPSHNLVWFANPGWNMTGGQFISSADIDDPTGYLGLSLGHMSDVPVAAFDPIFWFHHWSVNSNGSEREA